MFHSLQYNIIIFTEIIKQKQFPLLFLTTLYLFPVFVTQSEKDIHKQGLGSFYWHIVNNSAGPKTKSHGCLVNKPLTLLDWLSIFCLMTILQSMLNHRSFSNTTGCNRWKDTSDLAWCIQILEEQSNHELLLKGCFFFDFLR